MLRCLENKNPAVIQPRQIQICFKQHTGNYHFEVLKQVLVFVFQTLPPCHDWITLWTESVSIFQAKIGRERDSASHLDFLWFDSFYFPKNLWTSQSSFDLSNLKFTTVGPFCNCLNPHENFPHVGLGSQKLVCQKPKLLISQSEMAINFKSVNYLEFWRKCFVGCRVFARKISRLFVLRFLVTHDYLLHLPNFFRKIEEDSGHKVWVNGPVYRNMILSFLLTVQIILNDAEEIMIKENCSNT